MHETVNRQRVDISTDYFVVHYIKIGDNIDMDVELIMPIAIEEGLRFAIREGGRTVGSGVVIAVEQK